MSLSVEDKKEIERRRTFAIISHPDAGKTTITEKLLLYGGAIHEAGEVKAKKDRRATRSDWMKLEQERGISVSSSVMQFESDGLKINLLDTPGHADFSEDTYRTLTAADAALMMLDNAKGVEKQTKKLFDVCKLKSTPIFTFINKMDREGLAPLDLLDEVEKTLGIECNPITWPIGMGSNFKGIYHREKKKLILFLEEGYGTHEKKELTLSSYDDPKLKEIAGEEAYNQFVEEIELIEGTIGPLDHDAFLIGKQTPLMFGSARSNFGIRQLLDLFIEIAPAPKVLESNKAELEATHEEFSAFVFKIQANMDKNHRDRIAFLRICSGKFERGMYANNPRTQKKVRLSYSQQFFAQDRNTVAHAYAGDIIGIHDSGNCLIGDSLYSGNSKIQFKGIPQFSPEHFAKVELKDPLKRKQLNKGIQQLCEEGTIQLFIDPRVGDQDPILGAVGVLQFDVLKFRLKDEYGVQALLVSQAYSMACWLRSKEGNEKISSDLVGSMLRAQDRLGNEVALFTSDFNLQWAQDKNPTVDFLPTLPIS